jgi:hypothetical protein
MSRRAWMRNDVMAGPGAPVAQDKGGFPFGRLLLGCGAIVALCAIVGVAMIVGAGFFVAKKVDEHKEDFAKIKEQAKELQQDAKRMNEKGREMRERAEARREANAPGAEAPAPADLFQAVSQPASADDLRQHMKLIDAWAKDPAALKHRAAHKKMMEVVNAGDAKPGITDAVEYSSLYQESMMAFEVLTRDSGGQDAALTRAVQVIALVSAARHISAQSKTNIDDPSSKATAAQMKADKPKVEAEYARLTAARAKIAALMGDGADPAKLAELFESAEYKALAEDQQRLATLASTDPGFILLAKLPTASLDAWSALGDKDRAALVKRYDRLPDLPMFGSLYGEKMDGAVVAPLLASTELLRPPQETP